MLEKPLHNDGCSNRQVQKGQNVTKSVEYWGRPKVAEYFGRSRQYIQKLVAAEALVPPKVRVVSGPGNTQYGYDPAEILAFGIHTELVDELGRLYDHPASREFTLRASQYVARNYQGRTPTELIGINGIAMMRQVTVRTAQRVMGSEVSPSATIIAANERGEVRGWDEQEAIRLLRMHGLLTAAQLKVWLAKRTGFGLSSKLELPDTYLVD